MDYRSGMYVAELKGYKRAEAEIQAAKQQAQAAEQRAQQEREAAERRIAELEKRLREAGLGGQNSSKG
jgi:transcription elongation GreA/GreB family factor